MNAAPARFKFDLDLGGGHDRTPFLSDQGLAALQQQARMDGYAEGFAEGERSATATATQALASATASIVGLAAQMLAGIDEARQATEREAVELAASVARKLAAHLLAREPTAELEALLIDCLASLEGVPHLVIRCHPDLADRVREVAAAHIANSGFTGRLIVMGDPDQKLSDGRIEWADGGLVRDMAAISAEVDKRIASYLAARGVKRPEETQP
jgi:flagellar assembly protein FliH